MKLFFRPDDKTPDRPKVRAIVGFFAVASIAAATGAVVLHDGHYRAAEQAASADAAVAPTSVLGYACMAVDDTRSHLDAIDGRLGQMPAEGNRSDPLQPPGVPKT